MKKIFVFFALLFLNLSAATLHAQDQKVSQLCIRFDNYSVELDQKIQQVLSTEKIVYTCIPSGLIIIEVGDTEDATLKRITTKIGTVVASGAFHFEKDMNVSQAEQICSGGRVISE